MEIEDSFGFSKKRSENSNSLKREFQRFRNENSRANFAPDPEEVGELVSDEDSIHDEIPLFPQEVKTGPEKKIPDPISLDGNMKTEL